MVHELPERLAEIQSEQNRKVGAARVLVRKERHTPYDTLLHHVKAVWLKKC